VVTMYQVTYISNDENTPAEHIAIANLNQHGRPHGLTLAVKRCKDNHCTARLYHGGIVKVVVDQTGYTYR
jgi:deoxycytidylate deaminase